MVKCPTKDGPKRQVVSRFTGHRRNRARVPSHVINCPRHPTSVLPGLITRRHALIPYGRPCDRSHCLVDLQRHFYKVGACLP